MLTMPQGVSVSFFDYSTKTAWLLSKAATEIVDQAAAERRDQAGESRPIPRSEFPTGKQRSKPSDSLKGGTLMVGLVLTCLSPVCPLVLAGMGVWPLLITVRGISRFDTRRSDKRLLAAGIVCLLALGVLFLGPMLLLWAIPDVASLAALASSSFGFGWGVLLIGSIVLLLGGAVRAGVP
jgi:hypothetical protein